MIRTAVVAAFSVAILVSGAATASAQSASLTRIEPRPYYGAVVTIEEGVRVFRPLPRTKRLIINPDHRTPLNLTVSDGEENRGQNVTSNVRVNTKIISKRRSINHRVNPRIR